MFPFYMYCIVNIRLVIGRFQILNILKLLHIIKSSLCKINKFHISLTFHAGKNKEISLLVLQNQFVQ